MCVCMRDACVHAHVYIYIYIYIYNIMPGNLTVRTHNISQRSLHHNYTPEIRTSYQDSLCYNNH